MIRWKLRVVMADRHMSTQELAERMGMSRVSISRLRNTPNDSYPRITGEVLDKLCTVLNCQPSDLIEHRAEEA